MASQPQLFLSLSTPGPLASSSASVDVAPAEDDPTLLEAGTRRYSYLQRSRPVTTTTLASSSGGPSHSIREDAQPTTEEEYRAYTLSDEKDGVVSAMELSRPFAGPDMPLLQEIAFVGTVVMAQFLSLAALGQGLAPREIIAHGLGVDGVGPQAWFTASFALTAGTFILVSGRLGDIFGHKRIFSSGYAVLGLSSAFAGFGAYVHSQEYFEVCRAFQGIGAAMLIPNALALLGRAYPQGITKNLIFALFGVQAPWGTMAGACFGSLFAQFVWW